MIVVLVPVLSKCYAKPVYVHKGIKLGSLTSPDLFNNNVIRAQAVVKHLVFIKVKMSLLIGFADDVINITRVLSCLEENFALLQKSFNNIGLDFNLSKSEVLLFNWKNSKHTSSIRLVNHDVVPSQSITYLGLPIGNNLKSTC